MAKAPAALTDENSEGYVLVWRRVLRSAVFQDANLLKLWLWCLLRANHRECWTSMKTGRGDTLVHLLPGQFIFGRKAAGKALRMKQKTVEYRIKNLAKLGNLAIQPGRHYSIITICNWDSYQNTWVPRKGEVCQPTANQLPTNCQPTATDNNVNNEDNENKNPPTPHPGDIFDEPAEPALEFGGPVLPPRDAQADQLAAVQHIAIAYAEWQVSIDANPALRTMPTRWTTPITETYRARGLEFIKLVTVDVLKAAYADSEGGKFMGWGKVEQYLDSDAYRSRQRRRDGPSMSDAERSIEAAKKRETEYWAKRVADAKAKEQEKANASVEVPST